MDIFTILVFLQCSLVFQLTILNVLLINGSESRNFRFYHDSYQSSPMMNRIKYFQFRWDSLLYVLDHEIQILTLRSKKFSLSELLLLYFKFSPKMDVFTHKRILHDYSFKRNQRPATCSILTLWCALWLLQTSDTSDFTLWCNPRIRLHGMTHTNKSDSAVRCTAPSFVVVETFDSVVGCTPWSLTQQWDAHRKVWLSKGCTP